MICPTCNTDSQHLKILSSGKIICHACGGYSESSAGTDRILTRNAPRITEQAEQYEADLITPYVVDKSTNKVVVNTDFIELYPTQAAETFSETELRSVGQEDLKAVSEVDNKEDVIFSGDAKDAISDIIGA